MTTRCRKLLVGAIAFFALAPSMHGQNRNPPPVVARPKPQKPVEIPPAVVVLQVDTAAGDSTRTIIQRDFDYGDRMQPLILDSATLDDIWRPGQRNINFAPLAQTRANFVVRARATLAGLHVEVYDVPRGRLRQEDYFRLPKVPAYRMPAIKDSLSTLLERRTGATIAALTADSVARDSLARAGAKPVAIKTTRDRANARRAEVVRDSLSRELDRRDVLLRANAVRDTLRTDSVYARLALKDSVVRDSLERERRLGIHVVSDEIERWITGTRGISATRIAFIDGTRLKIVDSDGANERVIPTVGAALSPAWHPSGRYLVYSDADDHGTRIAQVDLRTMRPRLLAASNRGLNITPAYTRDGKNIVWASGGDSPAELVLASAAGDDTVPKPFVGRTGFETTSPSFSPDGKQIVFMSPFPLTPQLYTMNVDGTGLRRITPIVTGKRSYRTGAEWSPSGDEIAFQQQNGDFQVWTIRVKDRLMTQLTNEGENEDPSWAPDGRHLAITRRLGAIGDPRAIWILDERTGRLRQLTLTGDARLSDWSPPLRPTY
jgi:tol-pal system beta propeller repeat protein TolB